MDKNIYFFKDYLIDVYGKPLYRIPIDFAMSCPHRINGEGGCLFCAENGSRAVHLQRNLNIHEQIDAGIRYVESRYSADGSYIAYFQAYTNTYAELTQLKKLYSTVLNYKKFKMLMISTRPDCLSDEIVDYLAELSQTIDLWVELGVQSSNDNTLMQINRGHNFESVINSVNKLHRNGIKTVAHIILGLPGESEYDYFKTINDINALPFNAVKIHNLLVLRESYLGRLYTKHGGIIKNGFLELPQLLPIPEINEYEYVGLLINILSRIPADRPIMRLTADADSKNILFPKWNMSKGEILKLISDTMIENNYRQGDSLEDIKKFSKNKFKLENLKVLTLDKSYTFYSPRYKENYHTSAGAESESVYKFIVPSELELRLKDSRSVSILDVGFGLGYNSISSIKLNTFLGFKLKIISLEYDSNPLTLAQTLFDKNSLEFEIITSLKNRGMWQSENSSIDIILGDARDSVLKLKKPSFDIIYMDGFSTGKNSELWTYDFIKKCKLLLNENGIIVTYSAAHPVRGAFIRNGMYVGESEPFGRKKGGTVAAFNKSLIKKPLSEIEQNIILHSTAGTPYRDFYLYWKNNEILDYRNKLVNRLRRIGVPKWYT